MTIQYTGIVLRAPSVHKRTVTLFDSQLGKIEAVCQEHERLSHGCLISYRVSKGAVRYFLQDVQLLDMPFELVRDHVLFFHHILELCDYFLPLEMRVDEVFTLVLYLFRRPESIATPQAQKRFLLSFLKRVGVQDDQSGDSISRCIEEHPQLLSLQTASFLKVLEGNEKLA